MIKFLEYLAQREREKIDKEKSKFNTTIRRNDEKTPNRKYLDYMDIGHGKNDIVKLWFYEPKSGTFDVSEELHGNIAYHGDAFPQVSIPIGWSHVFQGRYCLNNNNLSIIVPSYMPMPNVEYILKNELIPILRKKFNFKEPHVF